MGALKDLFFPRNCIGCGVSSPETFRYICWDCWADTTMLEAPFCRCCGDPVAGAVEHEFTCYSCSDEKPSFEYARSAVRYSGVAGNSLRMLKYKAALWLVPDLVSVLFNEVKAEYDPDGFDAVVPVPLHHVRQRERGYNQSGLLAKGLGRKLKTPVYTDWVKRIRPTSTQTNLTAKQRLCNMAGVFQYRKTNDLKGQRILLVDDVMTTGATVNACAAALKAGGATSVHVITVARG